MYRENIYEVIEACGEPVSSLIVPKNSGLKGYAWKLLTEAGLNLDKARKINAFTLRINGLEILMTRGEDIPQVVEDEFKAGRVVLGITGDDLYDEYRLRNPNNRLKLENTYDWNDPKARYRRPTLCLINKSGKIRSIPKRAIVAVNSKYEMTSRLYLAKSPLVSGRQFDPEVYSGDIEARVKRGTADCCIDTVYSGDTIDEMKLKIIDEVRFSDISVISPLGSGERGLLEKLARKMRLR